jgi:hypothetical protein
MSFDHYYVLNDKGDAVPEPNLLKWGVWFQKADRHVARTLLGPKNEIEVSTVFLGMDHDHFSLFGNFDPLHYRPLLWETMVFETKTKISRISGQPFRYFRYRPSIGEYQERYRSKEEALEGHNRIVAEVQSAILNKAIPTERK